MTRDAAEQIARIICDIFEHEEAVDPRTIAKMFQYMGRLDPEGTQCLFNPYGPDTTYTEEGTE